MKPSRPIAVRTLTFLRELSKEYGSTKSMEIWENLSNLIGDDDLKMDVFKLMLNGGKCGTSIKIQQFDGKHKVNGIKALRFWTNCTLFAAKDALESAEKGRATTMKILPIRINDVDNDDNDDIPYERLISELEEVGFTIELV